MTELPCVKTIAVDFDGVIHDYKVWRGACIIDGEPISGAIEWLAALIADKRFCVAIYSSRNHQPGGIAAMQAWLQQHGLSEKEVQCVQFPLEKPSASVFIDDRAMQFSGSFPGLDELDAFKPWWRRGSREVAER